MDSLKFASLRQKRPKSDTENRLEDDLMESPSTSRNLQEEMGKGESHLIDMKKKKLPDTKVRRSLKQEIMQLKKLLKDQLAVRHALEKALGYKATVNDYSSIEVLIPLPAKELIREIAVLELEVMHLEQYLLSLYRKAFDQQVTIASPHVPPKTRLKAPISCQKMLFQVPKPEISSKKIPVVNSTRILPSQMSANKLADESCCENLANLSINRSHSALNHRAVYSTRISPSEEPMPFLKDDHGTISGVISLAEYLGTSIADHVPETPNKISEDMVRCMGAIYSKLADPLLVNNGPVSSPASSLSSMTASSPQYIGDVWSPGCKNESNLDIRLINPFRIEGLKEFSGPYNAMVDVSSINRDSQRFKITGDLLDTYKSLVQKLATVDVSKMKNDEKMPFWINLHNALMMHAYLVHGVPPSSLKRTSLLIKATCIVGGHSVNAEMIQDSFLGCRMRLFGQWLQTFKHPRIKFKARDERRRFYAIEKKEPLLHFALCSGSHSDPAVRIYTAKRLYQQLETAKEEYIRATVGVLREKKILLPKLIESYTKDICVSSQKTLDMIQCHLPETMRIAVQRCQRGRSQKIIQWVPHNFSFRYLLSREVANPQII
ncbi:hypothetical protein KFK09_014473 [Dendrobium nobile]|uniref:Ternary complex factor MIP1, leucine-zipper n=1 Tax=Dendrobium nobile TaxID=94219 RepID=A0A8T3B3Z6_DENNO|nr:hypothetical protein KFK09_014473 [Dendrobium nobile]